MSAVILGGVYVQGLAFVGVSDPNKHIFANRDRRILWTSLCEREKKRRNTSFVEFFFLPYFDKQVERINRSNDVCPVCRKKLRELLRLVALED